MALPIALRNANGAAVTRDNPLPVALASAGRPFHGEFSSADASGLAEATARVTLYYGDLGTAPKGALSLGGDEVVVITDLKVVCGASGLTVTVYDGKSVTVTAGTVIDLGTYAANGGLVLALATPHFCLAGTYPKVKTSGAGQIDVQIRGYIRRPAG